MDFLYILGQFIASAIGTLGFVILFNAPKNEYFFCALNGAIGWTSYIIATTNGLSVVTSSLISTFFLTIIGRFLSTLRKKPLTVFLLPGIFPIVPGAGIYYTSYYFIMNNFDAFVYKGFETFKISGAIVLGILFGLIIPQTWFKKVSAKAELCKNKKSLR